MSLPAILPLRSFTVRLLAAALPIAGALLLASCTATVQVEDGASGDLLDRLPARATVVGWFDVAELRESELAAPWLEEDRNIPGDEDYQDLRALSERIGIDPMRDIERLAFATYVVEAGEAAPVALVAVAYDESRLQAELQDTPTLEYEGRTLYRLDESMFARGDATQEGPRQAEPDQPQEPGEAREPGQPQEAGEAREPGYLVLLDDSTLLIGSEAGVKAAIDVADGRTASIRDASEMTDLLENIPAGANVWIVASSEAWAERLGESGLQESGLPVPQTAIKGIELAVFSLRLTDGFDARLAARAANEEDAKLLTDSLQGLMAMGKMMLQQQQPELFQVLDRAVTVNTSARVVELQTRLSGEDVETLRRLAEDQAAELEAPRD